MNKLHSIPVALFLLFSIAACQPAGPGTPTNPPDTATPRPMAPATLSSGLPFMLGSITFSQSGASPNYTIKVATPVLNGSDDPHVVAFNRAVSQVVQEQVAVFRESLKDASTAPISGGSSFDLSFELVSQPGNFVSLQLKMDQYMDGAAHPSHTTVAFNYDLDRQEQVSLEQLFTPGASYLQALADYCQAELGKREIGFDAQQHGADPTPENYRNWNTGPDGLVITFDEDRVAPYAAGPQIVIIPYAALKEIIDPQGPLAVYIK